MGKTVVRFSKRDASPRKACHPHAGLCGSMGSMPFRAVHCIIKTRNCVSGCVKVVLSGLLPRKHFAPSQGTKQSIFSTILILGL